MPTFIVTTRSAPAVITRRYELDITSRRAIDADVLDRAEEFDTDADYRDETIVSITHVCPHCWRECDCLDVDDFIEHCTHCETP